MRPAGRRWSAWRARFSRPGPAPRWPCCRTVKTRTPSPGRPGRRGSGPCSPRLGRSAPIPDDPPPEGRAAGFEGKMEALERLKPVAGPPSGGARPFGLPRRHGPRLRPPRRGARGRPAQARRLRPRAGPQAHAGPAPASAGPPEAALVARLLRRPGPAPEGRGPRRRRRARPPPGPPQPARPHCRRALPPEDALDERPPRLQDLACEAAQGRTLRVGCRQFLEETLGTAVPAPTAARASTRR